MATCEWGGCDQVAVELIELYEDVVSKTIRLSVCSDHLEEAGPLYPDNIRMIREIRPEEP